MTSILNEDIVDCYYVVKFSRLSNLFQNNDELKNLLKYCDEFFIKSKMFKSHKQCVSTVTQLLSNLTSEINQISNNKYIIVSKINPKYFNYEQEVQIQDEKWDAYTIIRYYVAEVDLLKIEGILKFTILGEVKYDNKQIELIKKMFTGSIQ